MNIDINVVSTVVLVAHWLIVVGLSVRVIMVRPPVGVALAWLTVVFSVPFAGAVTYLFFGERRLGRRRATLIATNRGVIEQWRSAVRDGYDGAIAAVAAATEPLRRQAEHVVGLPALPGNEIALLHDVDAVFDALVDDIDAARRRCHLCFYIWHAGGRTADVVDALVRAAERGVECRALADAIGSRTFLRSEHVRRLRRAGVQFVAALPAGPIRAIFVRRDLRNHRKIVVIDDRVAYTGSQNLVDPRHFRQSSGVGHWVDAIARIRGPAAAALDGVFAMDWTVETGDACELPSVADGPASPAAGALVHVVPSGPDRQPTAIDQLLLTAIYGARRRLVMTTPYFVPDDSMLTALRSAAARGVRVILIVPARNDSWLVRYASAAHFDDLLAAGVEIAQFTGGLLHTKSLTIDDEVSIFGSVNLDMRSLRLNFEISLFVYDEDFTRRLAGLQESYRAESERLDLEAWRRRPAARRFTENVLRLAGPLL